MDDQEGILEVLDRAIERRQKVQLERITGGRTTYWNGFPIERTADFVMVRTLDDFRLDGFAVLRLGDVVAARSGDPERFFERVLRSEGLLERMPSPGPIRLDNWVNIVEDVGARHKNAIVECEALDQPEFYLGELVDVDHDALRLLYIHVNGTKEVEPTRVPLDDVTLVRFCERYLELFAKYAVPEDRQ